MFWVYYDVIDSEKVAFIKVINKYFEIGNFVMYILRNADDHFKNVRIQFNIY